MVEQVVTKENIKQFLNELRASGKVNMFGASTYLQDHFGITEKEANKHLSTWMAEFSVVN